MKFEFYETPYPHIVIKNVFGEKINQNILKEAIKLERKFEDSTTGPNSNLKINKNFRSNVSCSYYDIYPNNPPQIRNSSPLLSNLKKLFNNSQFREVMISSPYPLCEFLKTDTNEAQVSRYGNNGQKYDWHVDHFGNDGRIITLVYYFFKEPKKFKGGELCLTNNPILKGKIIGKPSEIKTIIPENNMAVIFPSQKAHCVLPTMSPKRFGDGRFSLNAWVGRLPQLKMNQEGINKLMQAINQQSNSTIIQQ